MKAIVFTEYGAPDVLQQKDVPKPKPQPGEVLIKIHATTVTSADCRIRAAVTPPGFGFLFRLAFGLKRPRKNALGIELAGEVEALGEGVTRFGVGDRVFAIVGERLGAYAEYICLKESAAVALVPANVGYKEAAAISFGGTTALHFLRNLGKIEAGQQVLINGASGCVGTFAVQLARHFGAEVTGVCSAANHELVTSLGATHTIDYTQQDFTQTDNAYDLIFDAVGNITFAECKRVMKSGAKLLPIAAGVPQFLQMMWTAMFSRKKVVCGMAPEKAEDLAYLQGLIHAGEIKPVIDRCYPLEDIVEAHRYVDTGRKKGCVVVEVVP